jgi:hypothetical protein
MRKQQKQHGCFGLLYSFFIALQYAGEMAGYLAQMIDKLVSICKVVAGSSKLNA